MPGPIGRLGSLQDLPSLDTAAFPLVRGFQIQVRDTKYFGRLLHFCDGSGKTIANFPWTDHVDSVWGDLSVDVVSGTAAHPFHEFEQSWDILIWRDAQHVFVLQGDGEGEYETCFRVPVHEFDRAWAAATPPQVAFRSIRDALARPHLAKALLLFNAQLGVVPGELFTLTSLEHLELGKNGLVALPPEIGRLKQLRVLDLRFNRLSELPAELGELQHLEAVDLAENSLTQIPEWVARMRTLRVFFVAGNPIDRDSLEAARRLRPDVEFDYPKLGAPRNS